MTTPVGVLALQGAFARHISMLEGLGVAAVEVRTPEQLGRCAGLVLPGGESTTLSKLLTSSGLAGCLTDAVRAGLPVLGTCAGMILLATEVLDAGPDQLCLAGIDLTVRRNGYGRQVDSFETEVEVDGRSVLVPFIRAPVVERCGPGVDVLAHVDSSPVLCRQGPVTVAAFHPELGTDPVVHRLFLDSIPVRG